MKVVSIVLSALVAVASAEAAAAPIAAPAHQVWCYRPGEPCSKLKRAADAAAEALAGPLPGPNADPSRHVWCYRPGEPCSKAKRDALALAEAVAEAYASANPEAARHTWCYRPGEPCSKAKRDALASAEAAAEAHAAPEAGKPPSNFMYSFLGYDYNDQLQKQTQLVTRGAIAPVSPAPKSSAQLRPLPKQLRSQPRPQSQRR